MADLVDSIRAELRTRLDELRPLVREYERLREAVTALGNDAAARAKPARPSKRGRPPARRGRPAPIGARRRSSSAAEREANRETVLALVRERPGITRAELKDAAGLSSAGVAQHLRRMLDRGEVREEALPSGATGYRTGDEPTAPTASGRAAETGQ